MLSAQQLQGFMAALPRLLVFLVTTIPSAAAAADTAPRLGASPRAKSKLYQLLAPSPTLEEDFTTHYYTQPLDHFNYRPDSFITFQQRYLLNSEHWGGANTSSPIFIHLGAEYAVEEELDTILDDWAPQFNALIVFIEHRYYGKSMPFGSRKQAFSNTTTLGYFNSAQALADYAELIIDLKKNLTAQTSPVIVVGESYGRMLAAWFRLKYPHIVSGSLASSAPIFNYARETANDPYYSIVSNDYKESSKSCYDVIRRSWSVINRVGSRKNGPSILTQKFRTCDPINSSSDLKDFLDSMYCDAAQYDRPSTHSVDKICKAIDGGSNKTDADILTSILAGIEAYKGEQSCYRMDEYYLPTDTNLGWAWQICSDLVAPSGRTSEDTIFETWYSDIDDITKQCRDEYGDSLTPRAHWLETEFGGYDLKLALPKFGSNIIFSNGLKDPWSATGVLEDISNTVIAITTKNGSHCLDIRPARQDDPNWLVEQRKSEVDTMKRWIKEYYSIHKIENKSGSNRWQSGMSSPFHILQITAVIVILSCF